MQMKTGCYRNSRQHFFAPLFDSSPYIIWGLHVRLYVRLMMWWWCGVIKLVEISTTFLYVAFLERLSQKGYFNYLRHKNIINGFIFHIKIHCSTKVKDSKHLSETSEFNRHMTWTRDAQPERTRNFIHPRTVSSISQSYYG